MEPKKYDIAIIGAGISGTILSAILAKSGLKVVVFEAGQHPKFAIGESMILESSEIFRTLSETYGIPELAYFSSENYFPFIGGSHGIKKHFAYLYHRINEGQKVSESLMANIPKEPYGQEIHIYRQDSDYFMLGVAIKYGATILQNKKITSVDFPDETVSIKTNDDNIYVADYVVDASGFRSPLADKFKLREFNQKTHSRTIFTHAIDVPSYHQAGPSAKECGLPYSLDEGTLHHVFKGGWLWVIPFDNHPESTSRLCSIGLVLDPRVYPVDETKTPGDEFYSFIDQFPSIARQLSNLKPVRNWVRTGRLQYGSKKIIGNRWCLLGHAAGFTDALFSKGLYVTLTSVNCLAKLLIDAHKDQDYSTTNFSVLEKTTQRFLQSNDLLISGAFKSFSDFRLWRHYSILWVLGAYLEYLKLCTNRINYQVNGRNKEELYLYNKQVELRLVGGGFEPFHTLEKSIFKIMDKVDIDNEQSIKDASLNMKKIFELSTWVPHSIKQYIYQKHLDPSRHNLSFFKNKGGILGTKEYRKHFFESHSIPRMVGEYVLDKRRYSRSKLTKQKIFSS